MSGLGFRVERDGHHFVWKMIRDDGRVRSATPEERVLWEMLVGVAEGIRCYTDDGQPCEVMPGSWLTDQLARVPLRTPA